RAGHRARGVLDRIRGAPHRRPGGSGRLRPPGEGARPGRPAVPAGGVRSEELPERIGGLLTRLKDAEKELATFRHGKLLARAAELAGSAEQRGRTRFVGAVIDGAAGADDLRSLALDVRQRLGSTEPGVVVLGGVIKDRPVVVAATNEPARSAGIKAGSLVRTAAGRLGGGGGGKDDVAQGGGTDTGALPEAVAA